MNNDVFATNPDTESTVNYVLWSSKAKKDLNMIVSIIKEKMKLFPKTSVVISTNEEGVIDFFIINDCEYTLSEEGIKKLNNLSEVQIAQKILKVLGVYTYLGNINKYFDEFVNKLYKQDVKNHLYEKDGFKRTIQEAYGPILDKKDDYKNATFKNDEILQYLL